MNVRRIGKQNLVRLSSALFCLLAFACGGGSGGSDDEGTVATVSSDLKTIRGVIKGVDGNQSALKTWNMVHLERDTGITHVGTIDEYGFYSIDNVDLTRPATLLLLDGDFRFQSLLSVAGETTTEVKQYYTVKTTTLPNIVHKGSVLRFVDENPVTWTTDIADASANDPSIPKGAPLVSTNDVDDDGKKNHQDIDIDSDGLPNSFDDDDDGDTVLDIFDSTPNGNALSEDLSSLGDPYFSRDLSYLSVQIIREAESTFYLKFTARVRDDVKVDSLAVVGSSKTLDKALALTIDTAGAEKYETNWDLSLLDNGQSEDGEADDKVYAAKVKLSATAKLQVPEAGQVFFVRLTQTRAGKTITSDFPYRTPDFDPSAGPTTLTLKKEEASKRKFLPGQKPFGAVDYLWSFHLFDTTGIKVFATPLKKGEDTEVLLPGSLISAGTTYQGEYTAISQERIPGYPSWIVKTGKLNVTIESN